MKIQKPVIEKPVLYLWDTAEPAILLPASPGTWAWAAKLNYGLTGGLVPSYEIVDKTKNIIF